MDELPGDLRLRGRAVKPDGTPDPTFSGDGKNAVGFGRGTDDLAYGMALAPSGRIALAGVGNGGGDNDFSVARFLSTGALDSAFSGNGWTRTDFGGANDSAFDVAVQGDDKVVTFGYSDANPSTDFAVARYTIGGAPDPTFSGNGRVTTNFGTAPNTYDLSQGGAIQGNGRIVAVGTSGVGFDRNFAVARYLGA